MSARLVVDLDAFSRNLTVVRERVAPARHMLVVKDDAYGHGLVPIVQRAWDEGVRWFGAFDVPTGQAVRAAVGPHARIFSWMLAGTAAELARAVASDLDLGVGDRGLLEDVGAHARGARVHLKVDTGLHRNGIRPEQWNEAVLRAAELERAGSLRIEGLWSHIAEASDTEDDFARDRFLLAREEALAAGLTPSVGHLAASAAAFARPEFREDLVRVGAFAYGIAPSGGADEHSLGIEPVSSLVAAVVEIDRGRAHLDLGSFHGLPSALGGLLSVRGGGSERRIVRIDPMRTVVEGWPGAVAGDHIVLLGAGALQTMSEAADRIGTIGEELAVRVSPLVPREYVGGK